MAIFISMEKFFCKKNSLLSCLFVYLIIYYMYFNFLFIHLIFFVGNNIVIVKLLICQIYLSNCHKTIHRLSLIHDLGICKLSIGRQSQIVNLTTISPMRFIINWCVGFWQTFFWRIFYEKKDGKPIINQDIFLVFFMHKKTQI